MLGVEVLDLYSTPMPKPQPRYNLRLIWCALTYIDKQPFYANRLTRIIREVYNEEIRTQVIAHHLKSLASQGYIERIRTINDLSQYVYTRTAKFQNKMGDYYDL